MYPIAWFPMIDPNETYSSDYIKTNKGLETIYREDVTLEVTDTVKHFFGWCPKFVGGSVFSFTLNQSLGEQIQKGFSVTATIYMEELCTTGGVILSFSNTNRTIEIGYNFGLFYIKNGSNLNVSEVPIGDALLAGHTYAIAILFSGTELRVYMNKTCVYTNTCYYPSTNLANVVTVGGAVPLTIMNIKVYDSELSMKQLLEDYAFLYGHYKFDGSSSDDVSYSTEYDCSGVGVDVVDESNFSLSSTYSPIRQYSAVIGNGFTIPAGSHFYVCAWVNILSTASTIIGISKSDQNILSIGINGSNIETTVCSDCTPLDTVPSLPYTSNTWVFIELGLSWQSASRVFKVRLTKLDEEPVSAEYTFNSNDADNMSIEVAGGIAISDLRVYMNALTDAEVSYLINRNVHIDDKGTLYATELQELSHLSTFGFGDRGQIMAPDFTDTSELNKKDVMQYDYLNGIMKINNFKEV